MTEDDRLGYSSIGGVAVAAMELDPKRALHGGVVLRRISPCFAESISRARVSNGPSQSNDTSLNVIEPRSCMVEPARPQREDGRDSVQTVARNVDGGGVRVCTWGCRLCRLFA